MRHPALLILLLTASSCTVAPPPVPLPESESALTQETTGRQGEDRDPEVSPDGAWIFFASTFQSTHYDLYRKRTGSNVVQRIVGAERSQERFPKINPKKPRELAFASDASGEWDIYVIENFEKETKRWKRISEEGTMDLHPSWSPDGNRIAYCSSSGTDANAWVIKIADLRSGTIDTLEQIDGGLPEWSPVPGDDRIVFQRMPHRDSWFFSLWTLRFRDGKATELTMIFGDGAWAAINPDWSPDGTEIVFNTVGKSRNPAGKAAEPDDLWKVSADGTHPTQLTTHSASEWMPKWAADGRIYFLSNRSGSARIWSLDPGDADEATGE